MTKKVLKVSREKVDDVWECKKLQIIAHGLGSAEALVALSSFPATGERLISQLISLAPCPIPTYHDEEDDRRILSGETDTTAEPPRELSDEATDLVEEKRGRLLKKSKAPKNAKKSKSPKKKSKSKEENMSTESGSLGHDHYYDNEEFWDRTERYCTAYPDNC